MFDYNANGFRLPTEAEWEIASRGGSIAHGSGTYGTNYAGSSVINEVAWYAGNSETTHPVGGLVANELTLFDMNGNAFEWCWDWEGGETYPSSSEDPVGADTGERRLLRGGSYLSDTTFTVFARHHTLPDSEEQYIGFRIARNEY